MGWLPTTMGAFIFRCELEVELNFMVTGWTLRKWNCPPSQSSSDLRTRKRLLFISVRSRSGAHHHSAVYPTSREPQTVPYHHALYRLAGYCPMSPGRLQYTSCPIDFSTVMIHHEHESHWIWPYICIFSAKGNVCIPHLLFCHNQSTPHHRQTRIDDFFQFWKFWNLKISLWKFTRTK